jgi:DNA-binding Lrp family transcriptional regulator
MARARAVQAFKDESQDLEARIVSAIGLVGPRNIALISRMTGAHQETVRYKIKKRFRRLGFRFHAEADYWKLGLVPHWAELRLSPKFIGTPRSLFLAMNKSAYLVYYGKLLPQGSFACLFAIPHGRGKEHEAFLSYLQHRGIIQNYTLKEVATERHTSMKPDFFNFQSNRWEVDWNKVTLSKGAEFETERRSRPTRVDYNDLLLVKELQLDATQHTVSIAKKLRVQQKTLEYHYRVHVQKEKLISSYVIRWQHDVETSVSHSALLARLTFRNLGASLPMVQRVISKIPFVWAEDLLDDGNYIATIVIPVLEATSTFDYLNSQVPDLYGKVELSFVKRSEASLFTVPYQMYDKGWKYDLEKMNRPFRALK